MKASIVAPALAVAAGIFAVPAWAVPASGLAGLSANKPAKLNVEQVRHRCYVDGDGDYYCPSHNVRPYSYGYNYGYAPGFSLYIGRDRGWNDGYYWRDYRDNRRRPTTLRERK